MPPSLPSDLRQLASRLSPGTEVYLVGGAVRDLLLGRPLGDLDLAVPRGAVALARHLADGLGAAFVALDEQRGVARIVWERPEGRLEVDVADFRAADLEGDLRARDLTVNAMAMPLDGARGANALSGGLPEVIDPAGGRQDLRDGVVRLLSPAVLRDDPLRTLRAVRVAAQLGFRLDPQSAAWIAAAAPLLATAAPERVREELWKCIVAPAPAATLRRLDELGLLALIVPETVPAHGMQQSPPHREDVWEHSLSVVEQTAAVIALVRRLAAEQRRERTAAAETVRAHRAEVQPGAAAEQPGAAADPLLAAALAPFATALDARLAQPLAVGHQAAGHLLLGALFHDLGKPATRSVGEDGRIHFYGHEEAGARLAAARLAALRFAQSEVQQVSRLVRHHMRPLQLQRPTPLPPRSLHRFHHATDEVGPEVCLLSLADNLAKGEARTKGAWSDFVARVAELLDAFFFRHQDVVAPAPLLRGGDLMAELEAPAGAWVGELLRALAEAQAVGEVRTREEAAAWARQWWQRQRAAAEGERAVEAEGEAAGEGESRREGEGGGDGGSDAS